MFNNEPFIIKKFSEDAIMDGIDLVDNDAVIQVDLDADPGLIQGKVKENGTIYTATISIDDENLCECSCGKKFCKHQAAILVKATADYSKNYVIDAIDELEDDQAKDILKKLVELHPELTSDIIPMVLDIDDEEIQELLGYDLDDEDEDDDKEYDDDAEVFVFSILDSIFDGKLQEAYFKIIDFIDTLSEKDPIDQDALETAVDLMVKLYVTSEMSDHALFSRISQWMEKHQNSYLERYNINLAKLIALQDFTLNNPYARMADEIQQSNYLSRGPSTAKKIFDLVDEIIIDQQMPEGTNLYALDTLCQILHDIQTSTKNQKLKREIRAWFMQYIDTLTDLGLYIDQFLEK